jgi:alcohol dehydrogenase
MRVDATTICGTDLRILAGDVPEVHPGTILGHEAVGTVDDVAIEAVGSAATFELAVKLVRPGGRVANIGVHGKPAMLHLEDQWGRDITITTGLMDASSTPALMRLAATGQLDAGRFVTHRFGMDEFEQAYDVFGDAASNGALMIVLTREEEEADE